MIDSSDLSIFAKKKEKKSRTRDRCYCIIAFFQFCVVLCGCNVMNEVSKDLAAVVFIPDTVTCTHTYRKKKVQSSTRKTEKVTKGP